VCIDVVGVMEVRVPSLYLSINVDVDVDVNMNVSKDPKPRIFKCKLNAKQARTYYNNINNNNNNNIINMLT
jgi:hypothetical protein